ncbi:MAG TPA: zinc-ribbon domain containing protein [Methylomirabilota bacterium]|jgi:CxxC-x17-CxxC domain-containing protein
MSLQDKVLTCRDCGKEFLFTAGEQSFYAEKGFEHEPTRCKTCRATRKGGGGGGGSMSSDFGARALHPAVCSECGKETQVPFRPTAGKPVYCRDCFQRRGGGGGGNRPAGRRSPAYRD